MLPTLADVKQAYSVMPEVIGVQVSTDTRFFVVITSNEVYDADLLTKLIDIEGDLYNAFPSEIGEWFEIRHMARGLIDDDDMPNIASIMQNVSDQMWQEIIDEPYG